MNDNPYAGRIRYHQGWHIVETEDSESFELLEIRNGDDQLVCELHPGSLEDGHARMRLEALIALAEAAE